MTQKGKKQQVYLPVTNADGFKFTKSHVSDVSTGKNCASAHFGGLESHMFSGNNAAQHRIESSPHGSSTNHFSRQKSRKYRGIFEEHSPEK